MASDPKAVAERYFSYMQAGDLAVLDLFSDEATLQGLGMRRQGRAEIEAFYSGIIAGARPSPSPAGPLLCEGNRAIAEVVIELGNGTRISAIDVFVVEDGRIQSLTYYIADIPPRDECASGATS